MIAPKAFTKIYAMWPGCGWATASVQIRINIRLKQSVSPGLFPTGSEAGIAALKERDYLKLAKRLINGAGTDEGSL